MPPTRSPATPEETGAPEASGEFAYADTGLQLITEAITEVLGFQSAVILIRRGDNVETITATGDAEGRTQRGTETPED
ncbi:MAG: hypothetical protein J2O46_01650, partial [Nocardioides sp.]|nr:hypothetical protein [Nocardioides sp.]